jgi:hypothetical protein
MNGRVEAAMTNRTEACFRAITLAMHNQRRISVDGHYTNRAEILDTLRQIKAKAVEAELLLRAMRSGK